VETSRTKLNNEDDEESPQPIRKVIKPDFTLFLDSFDVSRRGTERKMQWEMYNCPMKFIVRGCMKSYQNLLQTRIIAMIQ
jgi:hypothetical protein